jgi:hypothetical protein
VGDRAACVIALLAALACGGPTRPDPPVVSELTMEIVPLNGAGHTVTFSQAGGARDVRYRELLPTTVCVGAVSAADFERVAAVFEAEAFFGLAEVYGSSPFFPPTTVTGAVRDGTRTTVKNYPDAAPAALLRVQEAVRELRQKTTWTAESGQTKDQEVCAYPFLYR